MTAWKPGDRVEVRLPRRSGRQHHAWFAGTVRDVDPAGRPRPGVVVDLDEVVNGLPDCYATHGELRRLPPMTGRRP